MMLELVHGDCLEWLRSRPDDSVDLVFGSPPYEDARTYGIGFSLKGQCWVDWMVERWREMNRICRGVIAMAKRGRDEPSYLPSEDRIAKECAKIRSKWSEADYGRRAPHMKRDRYEFPAVSVEWIRESVESEEVDVPG
jgi:hypothetical protein